MTHFKTPIEGAAQPAQRKPRHSVFPISLGLVISMNLAGCGGGETEAAEVVAPAAAEAPFVTYNAPIDQFVDPEVAAALEPLRNGPATWEGGDAIAQE